jgi:acyl dehydratase
MGRRGEPVSSEDVEATRRPGDPLGVTEWIRLPQEMFSSFETLTLSNDPLHMDPDWVRRHTDLPGTIAPGLLTLSLLPYFAAQLRLVPAGHHALNYGFDRVRWIAPVPMGSEVRARFVDGGTVPRPAGRPGWIARYEVTVEIRAVTRPAMVASWLGAIVPDAPGAE